MSTASSDPIDWQREVKAGIAEMKAFSRRGFFTLVGLVAFGVANLAALVLSLRFVVPNVTYDESLLFKAGSPSDYPIGSTTIFSDKRIALNRDADGFYAISLICTHLGCTPRWFQSDAMFRCPCHGSTYTKAGVRVFGPAPRSMDTMKITIDGAGNITVNTGGITAGGVDNPQRAVKA